MTPKIGLVDSPITTVIDSTMLDTLSKVTQCTLNDNPYDTSTTSTTRPSTYTSGSTQIWSSLPNVTFLFPPINSCGSLSTRVQVHDGRHLHSSVLFSSLLTSDVFKSQISSLYSRPWSFLWFFFVTTSFFWFSLWDRRFTFDKSSFFTIDNNYDDSSLHTTPVY